MIWIWIIDIDFDLKIASEVLDEIETAFVPGQIRMFK